MEGIKMEELNLNNLDSVSGGASKVIGQKTIINCKHRCNARSGPSDKYDIIGHAYLGKTYDFYGWSGSWAMLKIDGKKMYVYKKFIG